MSAFKIGYFADGPWSHKAFELLIQDKDIEICFIVPRTDTIDDTLENFADKYGIDYLHPVKVNSEEFIEKAKTYNCDLFVSMSFNQIFRERLINLPKYSTINCHAGKLPFYRGRNILNWVLINDEKKFGITVHFVDEGIDTGDIILQKTYSITDEDTYGTLLEVAYDECAKLLYNAIKQIQDGSFKRIKQNTIHPVGFYCGSRTVGDEIIEWKSTSREIFNFVRALSSPGPLATTYIDNTPVKINRVRLIKEAPKYINIPGQILSKTENGFLVKTKDSFVEILDIDTEAKIRVGARFEND
ncbi:MAG: methionyl-tRNA formyltransferase [Gracilimonas sp.]|uniref:methionyl-tRNA formyltransferase n=1 Tax=Gracilimonas sp. TaxID=1974203 RepID=UPI001B115109|nr:methionyl-tRNA formyltransferase [Gracilimonas sp.]MBO6587231.1 methionyl-tRNA formyltransferase [Gracilimonas sp.]MBO6614281.1 methionyl-tRNA formyltransferase [Gracilimonas sp.]